MEGWSLWRQDDHGNTFWMRDYDEREDADRACATFTARGHHQTYWVEAKISTRDSSSSSTSAPSAGRTR